MTTVYTSFRTRTLACLDHVLWMEPLEKFV